MARWQIVVKMSEARNQRLKQQQKQTNKQTFSLFHLGGFKSPWPLPTPFSLSFPPFSSHSPSPLPPPPFSLFYLSFPPFSSHSLSPPRPSLPPPFSVCSSLLNFNTHSADEFDKYLECTGLNSFSEKKDQLSLSLLFLFSYLSCSTPTNSL